MSALSRSQPLKSGFIVLHGNRSEELAQTVLAWQNQHPLDPLEEEVILVQSSGMAEWFKMTQAQQLGVCSAAKVELPGRFIWRAYRHVLGSQAVPRESPLDKLPMTWRLMPLLPSLLARPEFGPLARYLCPDGLLSPAEAPQIDETRLLQLASQLADLFDQYQNYRTDWLQSWALGQDVLIDPQGQTQKLPPEQHWQPELWRALLGTLSAEQRNTTRPDLHRQVLAHLVTGGDFTERLPRRVVVFGMSHMPASFLETLSALARHCQIILAVPNPCRFYWGDIMEGRELFRTQRQRQARRGGGTAVAIDLQDMHLHAHPLLAAWGRQGRDFVRQLDAFDDAVATQNAFPSLRIDLFDEQVETSDTPMLTRLQQRIRDLEPLTVRHDDAPLAATDRSVVFHVAHSAVRELEVLHDQLLDMLAQAPPANAKPLQPRDIVVMVPDVQDMAAAIRAVFGQYPRHDKRYIPFDIADLSAKTSSPLVQTVAWLLTLPAHRFGLSEWVDLLEVPAVAQRFGIEAEKLPQLTQWMTGAGIRWGLHSAQREQLDLAACGEQNTAWFGLQRMLLGYASGVFHAETESASSAWQGIEPYAEVGGLDAALAGGLAHLFHTLNGWWQRSQERLTPAEWCEHARGLLAAMFKPVDEADAQALAALEEALPKWQRACEQAGLTAALGLPALHQGWMDALQEPSLNQRFRAGGVTFCTLMPMRAIPFEVVCLLGMNDGDYPRRSHRSDFDLMAPRQMFRPGDRSRQHDDRQLMLEALLSARRTLYISWTGRSVRDNSTQPPSVLVSQLRDYMASAWGEAALHSRTTEHPLQPFSRRYFEPAGPEAKGTLTTFAREWRQAHTAHVATPASLPTGTQAPLSLPDVAAPLRVPDVAAPLRALEVSAPLDVKSLERFFKNPVAAYFKERLGVVFWHPEDEPGDTEVFDYNPLEHYKLVQSQTRAWPAPTEAHPLQATIEQQLQALQRAGGLPMKGLGELKKSELQATLTAMAQAWAAVGQDFPRPAERVALGHSHLGVEVRDWLDGLCQNESGQRTWVLLEPRKITRSIQKQRGPDPEKLLRPWLWSLLAAASGHELQGRVVGQDGVLQITPMSSETARTVLDGLLSVWLQGQVAPLPLPFKTALVMSAGGEVQDPAARLKMLADAEKTYAGDDAYTYGDGLVEVNEMCLARVFPDFETLCAATGPEGQTLQSLALAVYGPLHDWARECVTAVAYANQQTDEEALAHD